MGLQTLFRHGSERLLPQSSRFPQRAFCTSSNDNPAIPLEESKNRAPIIDKTDDHSAFSQAPRILICNKVRDSARDRWSKAERVSVLFYAPELSQWVLDRRLSQLPKDIHVSFSDRNLATRQILEWVER